MLNALVAYAAEEGAAPNPLIPPWYDIIWSSVCFIVILIIFMFLIAFLLFAFDIVFGYFFYMIGVLKTPPF